MTAAEFDRWSVHSVAGFVRQQVASGLQPEAEARRDAARVFAEQLPDGRDTEHHHVLRVQDPDAGATVGSLWLRVRPGAGEVEGYVFDVELLPAARGLGLGRATMLAAHETARALGATVMRLNVFGHNAPAIALYESLGYEVADVSMQHRLDGPRDTVPSGRVVELRPMTSPEHSAFAARLPEHLAGLLPDGFATPGQLLWTPYDGTDPVGAVWLGLRDRSDGLHAFAHRLEVPEDLRRRGYGRAVAVAVLRTCREMGVRTLGLSVAGADVPARRLCEELGLTLTAQTMVLPLTGP